MSQKFRIEKLITSMKIQVMDKSTFENFEVMEGKRFLVRYKPFITKDDYYDGQLINGVSTLDFEITIVEHFNDRLKVRINNYFYWVERNNIFNWSERTRRQGWVITAELPIEKNLHENVNPDQFPKDDLPF